MIARVRTALASISRRVRTLLVAGILFIVLLVLAMTLPVPYVVLSPGPTYNTLSTYKIGNRQTPIIGISGITPTRTTGHLNLTTVSVSDPSSSLTVFDAISAWLHHDQVVVPKSSVYPPGQTTSQTDKQNAADFAQSQDNATVAAACELKFPKAFGVLSVVPKGPSAGRLHAGDELISLDGQPVDTYAKLRSVLAGKTPGARVTLVVKSVSLTRTLTQHSVSVTLGRPVKGARGASLGISVSNGPTCLTPYTVDLGLGNEIGGPSAGMMFALGIIDKVSHLNLTHGSFVAGTGTIDVNGSVGPIGGIQLKMIAARAQGATVFLAPAGNCGDVRGDTPKGLQVVKVATLHQAVQDLAALSKGRSVPHC